MQRERITVSLDPGVAARVRQCGARSGSGGASSYLERLVRQDETREAAEALAYWYAQRPERVDADEAERIAAAEELGESV